jgi:hypothetical protein
MRHRASSTLISNSVATWALSMTAWRDPDDGRRNARDAANISVHVWRERKAKGTSSGLLDEQRAQSVFKQGILSMYVMPLRR